MVETLALLSRSGIARGILACANGIAKLVYTTLALMTSGFPGQIVVNDGVEELL